MLARGVLVDVEGQRPFGRAPQAWKGALLAAAFLLAGCAQQTPVAIAGAQVEAAAKDAPTPTLGLEGEGSQPSATPAPTLPQVGRQNATSRPAVVWGTRLSRLPTTRKLVALTFDAGANADGVPSILRTLQATGTPATFFLTGKWVQTYPQLALEIGHGYQVGNHTYDHPYLPQLPDAAVRKEIVAAGTMIASATGHDPRPLFRFPYGDGDARTIAIANQLGYSCIQWTVDTKGWRGISGGQTVDSVVSRVMANLEPGEIVLMHVGSAGDHSTLDADALPRSIAALKAQGYSFTTLTS